MKMPWSRALYICYTVLLITDCKVLARTPDETASLTLTGTLEPSLQPQLTTPLPATVADVPRCFHRDSCPQFTEKCRCQKLENKAQVICCNIESSFYMNEGLACAEVGVTDFVSELHIRNATLPELNISLPNFRRLKSLSVTDGHISRVIGEFAKRTPIQCLNLSNNALTSIEERALVHLTNLSTLDISHNNLTGMPNFKIGTNIRMDISGNNEMECQSLFRAKNKSELHFENANKTFCKFKKTFHWFNSTILLPLVQVESVYRAPKDCWGNCTCEPYRLDIVPGKSPTFSLLVDCAGKQLTDMPSVVPENTIALNITNNNITTLKIQDPSFNNIRELYADNNQITSITELEGTHFLDNLVALSLRNNKLKTLPTYVLSNIFDRNPSTKQVHLGLNKLTCDCNSAKNLKIWLLTKNIRDYDEIMCENYPLKVIQLDPAKLCLHQDNQDWKDYIYYIITGEVLLLVCLVLKVSYDYWVFKTAGYLPWPASKMPKLPCDWLCE